MQETRKLSNAQYSEIAKAIRDSTPDVDSTIQVDCQLVKMLIILNVVYEVEYQNCIGGSYEDYDFEMLSEVANEYFTVKDYQAYTTDGDEIKIVIDTTKIEKLLN